MAHINYNRNVLYARQQRLENLLPWENLGASFAVLCGNSEQRRAAGLQGIRRCCGHKGIVVLQNDPLLAGAVSRLRNEMPELAERCPWFRTYSVNPAGSQERYYDPLYGLSFSAVLDAIAPTDGSGYNLTSVLPLHNYLTGYLKIMEGEFRRDPTPFGRYPFSLDLLLQLTQMSPYQLKQKVLRYLPQTDRAQITALLSADGAQQQAFAAVQAFATEMEDSLWTFRGFGGHTRVSIVEAVRQRCVISVTIPSSRPSVLRYIYQELKTLKEAQDDFLLVVSGVPLANSPELRHLFIDPHEAADYSTGVLASDLSHVIMDQSEVAPFLAEHHEVLIFSCASSQQAAPFSDALGTYQRMVMEEHTDRRRQPFHIFSDHGYGTGVREVTEHNINVQELLSLNEGAVLCGSLYIAPIIIHRVIL